MPEKKPTVQHAAARIIDLMLSIGVDEEIEVLEPKWLASAALQTGVIKHPGGLAGGMVVRGARCLAGWVLCVADTTAQSA